jgi:hypothetical protein
MASFTLVNSDLIPVNQKGKPSDLEFSIVFPSGEAAATCFRRAANRLRNPSLWHVMAGWASANFLLTDASGTTLTRLALEGDCLRIDVPGPGPNAGHGYDWVKVENIDDGITVRGVWEWIAMKLRPCPEPGKGGHDTAHFFREEASSTFVIERAGTKVTARYHGRNEIPNTSTENSMDNIRNAVVATSAMVSFSEAQWSALIKGLLTAEIDGER